MKILPRWILGTTALLAASAPQVRADVTVQQKTTLSVASMIHMHGANTTNWTADKKREDTESHCEGMMSMVCGNLQGGEIVRLDRDVTWRLQPSKKRYTEQPFATPEELAAVKAKMQANIDKMNSCPATQQQGVDKSKCQMSPPKIDVRKTGDKATFAGHEAQRTAATLTESCTNKETGDVCDTVVALDVWLTQDELPGLTDRLTFDKAYARKLGLDDPKSFVQGPQMQKFLAAYQGQLKELAAKSGDMKGQPLKTSFRILMGGPNCKSAAAKGQGGDAAGGSDAAAGANPVANVAQAGKVIGAQVGQLMGGLFKKKKTDDPQAAAGGGDAAATAAAPAAGAAPASKSADPYATQYVELASFSSETVSVSGEAIPASRFDVPPDWTKETPKVSKGGDDEFTCPKS
jgi:hypothetical protein